MLLGGKSYAIAMRKLSYCKIIALPLPFCSIFPTPFIRLYIKKTDKDLFAIEGDDSFHCKRLCRFLCSTKVMCDLAK